MNLALQKPESHILIVDDEASINTFFSPLFSEPSLNVLAARDKQEGLGIIQTYKEKLDLIIHHIDAAHLLLLENNKVRNPSPVMLKKLASAYDISFEDLMKAAGYVMEEAEKNAKEKEKISPPVSGLLKFTDDFKPKEIEELEKYIKFIRFKRKYES